MTYESMLSAIADSLNRIRDAVDVLEDLTVCYDKKEMLLSVDQAAEIIAAELNLLKVAIDSGMTE